MKDELLVFPLPYPQKDRPVFISALRKMMENRFSEIRKRFDQQKA